MNDFDFNNFIKEQFLNFINVELTDLQCKKFFDFMNFLIEKNKVMNLTAITDEKEIVFRHFIDSCMFYKFYKDLFCFEKRNRLNFLDVGTGAGFPGIPLAILDNYDNFVLTDTLGKRINFLEDVTSLLEIKNVSLVKSRAEDLAHNFKYREKFDFVFSRGVARIPVLAEYSLPFVKIGGSMVAFKMDDCDSELEDGKNALNLLCGKCSKKLSYSLFEKEPDRCLLIIDKIKNTPIRFPRKAGLPNKEPL